MIQPRPSRIDLTQRSNPLLITRFSTSGRGRTDEVSLIARFVRPLTLLIALLAISFSASAAPKKKVAAVGLDAPDERIVLSVLGSYSTGLSKDQVRAATKTLIAASEENGVDPFLVLGLIRVESSGWNRARSSCDARGMMQLMPFVGKAMAKELGIPWHGAETLHDPEVNIRLGIHYLASLQKRYDGDVSKALSAYSMGPTKLDRILARSKKPVDDYPISVRWFADHYRELSAMHGNVEPGLSRFEVAVHKLEKDIGGKPSVAYALATGKKDKDGWNKTSKPKTKAKTAPVIVAVPASTLVAAHP
jgi:soluble lytic murein transglycosylase-like protein